VTADHIPVCSIAKLLAAINQEPLATIYPSVGLLLCPTCQAASLQPEWYPHCNQRCYDKDQYERAGGTWMTLTCEECGGAFRRYRAEVEWRFLHGLGLPRYCHNRCKGKALGKNHGFRVRPESRDAGGYNRRKTHCPQGHPYDDANTYWYQRKTGGRDRCYRTCRRYTPRKQVRTRTQLDDQGPER